MSEINFETERYWDDVEVGDSLPEIVMALDATAMVLQVSGSQDWSRIHHDLAYAADSGIPNIFYNTGWTTGLLGRLMTDWIGPSGWVESLGFQMRGMNPQGSEVTASGKVVDKRVEDGKALVDVEVSLVNSEYGPTTPGKATIRLPRKS
jgi:acyl dehydratase